ncbi:WGR domain protein [Maioricimonas rarisocia]|uniref:WGR domain protein n=1 Tax=Maioricimonas rarisocia TaxID=2528026 RepID=A0A517Z2A0_9PLAN|nr:WGR domain-containing protein [Maioricimonas rarisocia]QDU36604.1 WGR domain protein [Maioricimonas rarisocia]
MAARRFELNDGNSSKFWEISQRGSETKVCFGRIGTNGQTREKEYESAAEAHEAVDKLVAGKLKKGYAEVSKAKTAATIASTKRTAMKAVSDAKPTVIDSTAAIPKNETLQFIGLVDPASSGGGIGSGRASKWTFSAGLVAWKCEGGPLVRETLDVIASNVSERRLSELMKKFDRDRILKFTAKRARRQTRQYFTVELVRFGGAVRDKDLSKVREELNQPIEIRDRTFGTLQFDREMTNFTGSLSYRGEELYLWIEAGTVDEAKAILEAARPLWRNRVKWFKQFQETVCEDMFEQCQDWREQLDQKPLTRPQFLRLLGNPVGLIFRMEEGELHYEMTGYEEELFTDHGVTVLGTLEEGPTEAFLG